MTRPGSESLREHLGWQYRFVQIDIVHGDITHESADALVNAANSSLMGGSGVDGAIHRVGGPAILAECRDLRATRLPDGLPTGEAIATTAGDLDARWVIHTVGPVYGDSDDAPELLAACYRNSLEVAEELGARTVVFPSISTGVYGYPKSEAAEIALRTVSGAHTVSVESMRFALLDNETFEAFVEVARDRYPDIGYSDVV